MTDPDVEWNKIGENEPYWGVCTFEKFRTKNLTPERKQEFFRSGEIDVQAVFDTIHSKIDKNFKPCVGLDFGCGVGRLTIPLSRYCDKVVGVDVSLGMLEEAKRNCAFFNVFNVDFVDDLCKVTDKVDFVITRHVLQHINQKRGMEIIETFIEKLNPSGIASIHLPYYFERSSIKNALKLLMYKFHFTQKMYNLFIIRDVNAPFMFNYAYNLAKIFKSLNNKKIHNLFLQNERINTTYCVALFITK
jgi:2-polyprenyl-3-methyl-5-hydroxy-6-metoxy-1,4-benzoquinol methylase